MVNIIDFGTKDYIKILRVQEEFHKEKLYGKLKENIILIGEHYPIYTCGKRTKQEHIYSISENIPIVEIERGGSVTFHGLGQIVVYPILNLKDLKLYVKDFVYNLEEILIRTCKDFEINVFRKKGYPGVFTKNGKIGFVGVKVSKFITMHGASLNVCIDKSYFKAINPCGINRNVVSMCDYTKSISMENVKKSLIKNILAIFI